MCLLETTDLHSFQWNFPYPSFPSFPFGNFRMRGTNQYELPICMVHSYVSSSTAEPMFNFYPLNSVLIDRSIYLKCWVFSLFFCFTGTISTCERFLGKSFFNVFHPFPRFQPFLHFLKVTTVDCLRIGWAFLSTIETTIGTVP